MSVDSVPSGKSFKFNSKTQAAVHKSVVMYLKSQSGKDLLKDVIGQEPDTGIIELISIDNSLFRIENGKKGQAFYEGRNCEIGDFIRHGIN